jgi:hypothetical protein
MIYYCDRHIPMVKQKLGAACKRVDLDQGLGGAQPGSKYTDIQPLIQLNEVKM